MAVDVKVGRRSSEFRCDEVKMHGSNEPKHEKYGGADRSPLTF